MFDYRIARYLLCCLSLLPFNLRGQTVCSDEDPFLLPPAKNFCVDTNGIALLSFNLTNVGQPGNYTVAFPDGTDTTYLGVEGSVQVRHALPFSCVSPPGSPTPPEADNPYYAYRGELFIRRTDCVDEDGKPREGTYPFNVIPNPIQELEVAPLSCREAPFLVDLDAVLCSQELIRSYAWFVDGRRVPNSNAPTVEDYPLRTPGDHLVRLEVTTFVDNCPSFFFERLVTVTAPPSLTLDYTIDSSQLCSPLITITPTVTAENTDAVRWSSTSPDVSIDDATSATPTITITNQTPGTRTIRVTAGNENCSAVTEAFSVTTFVGQTITAVTPLVSCSGSPYRFCDQLSYTPSPAAIQWVASDPEARITEAASQCPTVTFGSAGDYTLTATGTDVCGLPFTYSFPVAVSDGAPLLIDLNGLDTLCNTQPPLDLLDLVTPREGLVQVRGPGVIGTTFDPRGRSGPVTLELVDRCGVVYPVSTFVRSEGGFAAGNPRICPGDSLALAELQAGTYSGPGVANNMFRSEGLAPGSYPITYRSTDFCGGAGSFTITVEALPAAGFLIQADRCGGGGAAGATYAVGTPITLINTSVAEVRCYRLLETGEQVCDQSTATFTPPAPGRYTLQQEVSLPGSACTAASEQIIEVRGRLVPTLAYTVDSTDCDSVRLAFSVREADSTARIDWVFSTGDSSRQARPELRIARPVTPDVLQAVANISNGCFTVRDTFSIPLPQRFQVAFGVLNDNNTVCAGDTIRLADNSVNAERLSFLSAGNTVPTVPATLLIDNAGQEVLVHPLMLSGSSPGCPDQTARDTVYILPNTTTAAFGLAYADNCSPAPVELVNFSTPGASGRVDWGDGSTLQVIGEEETLVHTYGPERDTTYTISLEARLCGVDTFRTTYPVRASPTAEFTLTTDAAVCGGDTLQFASSAGGDENSLEWDFGDGQFSVAASPRHVYDTAGTYAVELLVTHPNGCSARDSSLIVVSTYSGTPLRANFPQQTCVGAPFPISLVAFTGGELTYDYGNLLRSGDPIARPYSVPGSYTLQLTARDASGCSVDTSSVVEVFGPLEVRILPDRADTTLALGASLDLGFRSEPLRTIDSVAWAGEGLSSRTSQLTTATPIEDGLYRLRITDSYGCTAGDSMRIGVRKEYADRVYVPNAFSPNGDGVNEWFSVDVNRTAVRNINFLRVFNRWGTVVYECSDCPPGSAGSGWDGRIGGQPAAPATYLWMAEILFADGRSEVFTGDVALIR